MATGSKEHWTVAARLPAPWMSSAVYKEASKSPPKTLSHRPQSPTSLPPPPIKNELLFVLLPSIPSLSTTPTPATMRLLALFPICALFALTLSAAVGSFNEDAKDISAALTKREGDFVPTKLPDGRTSVALYDGGVFTGTMLEEPDGDVTFLDADGKTIDVDDEAKLMKRVSVTSIAKKLGPFIRRWGKRAWNLIWCLGLNVSWKCADDILDCALTGDWLCIEGIRCGGVEFKKCAKAA